MQVGLAVVAQVVVGVVHSRVVVEHFGVVVGVVFGVVFAVVLHVVRVVHFGVVLEVVFAVVLTVARVGHFGGVFGVILQVVRRVVLLDIGRVVRFTILLIVLGVIRIIAGLLGTFLTGLRTAGRFMRMRMTDTFFLGTLQPSTVLKTTTQAKLGKYIPKYNKNELQ